MGWKGAIPVAMRTCCISQGATAECLATATEWPAVAAETDPDVFASELELQLWPMPNVLAPAASCQVSQSE